jgi:hypothetical protein
MVNVSLTLTLHDGRVLEIHNSACSKFFDIKLGIKPRLDPGDMAHGKLELSFALPKEAKPGGQALTPDKGAMVLSERAGRLSLK